MPKHVHRETGIVVRVGCNPRQKERLLAAALRQVPWSDRALLIFRLNQPHTTAEEARAQYNRIHHADS